MLEVRLPKGLDSLLDLIEPGDAMIVRCMEFRCACKDITKCRHKPGKKVLILDDLAYDGLVRRALRHAQEADERAAQRAQAGRRGRRQVRALDVVRAAAPAKHDDAGRPRRRR
jgi:hypothetical protein